MSCNINEPSSSASNRNLPPKASQDDPKAAVIDSYQIAAQPDLVVPAWFGPAMAHALEGTHDRLDVIEGRLDVMEGRLDVMEGMLRRTQSEVKQLVNFNRVGGCVVVPFLDGTDPTQHPHGLPPLVSREAVNALPPQQVLSYLNGYGHGPDVIHALHHDQSFLDTEEFRRDLLKSIISGRVI